MPRKWKKSAYTHSHAAEKERKAGNNRQYNDIPSMFAMNARAKWKESSMSFVPAHVPMPPAKSLHFHNDDDTCKCHFGMEPVVNKSRIEEVTEPSLSDFGIWYCLGDESSYGVDISVPLIDRLGAPIHNDTGSIERFFQNLVLLDGFPNLTNIRLSLPVFNVHSPYHLRGIHPLDGFIDDQKSLTWRKKVVCLEINFGLMPFYGPHDGFFGGMYDWIDYFPNLFVVTIKYMYDYASAPPHNQYIERLLDHIHEKRGAHTGTQEWIRTVDQDANTATQQCSFILPGSVRRSDLSHLITDSDLASNLLPVLLPLILDYAISVPSSPSSPSSYIPKTITIMSNGKTITCPKQLTPFAYSSLLK